METTSSGWLTKTESMFLLRRLHSLSGIIPIGGFLLFHFYENASARHGAEAFNETVRKISEMPYLIAAEWLVLLLPILFHSIYGLFITASARPNVSSYSYERNWAYFFQRMSGIIAFFYIGYHVITTRGWAVFVKGSEITFQDMVLKLSSPFVIIIYIIGILAVTYHFSNGLWSFSITWGIVKSEQGQKRLAFLSNIIFLVLSIVGLDIFSAFVLQGSFLKSLIGI
jgi:succinate dehydrogenase / fumarate reductase, cytochrome b subunit